MVRLAMGKVVAAVVAGLGPLAWRGWCEAVGVVDRGRIEQYRG